MTYYFKKNAGQPRQGTGRASSKKKMTPMNYGLFLLGRRDYSVSEIYQKMETHYKNEQESEQIDETIDRLIELGYLDDERYAQGYVRRESGRGQGPGKVRWSLKQKQVQSSIIESAMEDVDWFESCRMALESRIHRFTAQDTNKIYRFLAGRGFSSEHIQDSLSRCHFNDSEIDSE